MKKLTYILSLLLLSTLNYAREAKLKTMPQAPLLFIENKGQLVEQNSRGRSDIDYILSAGKNVNIFVGAGAIHYQWAKEGKKMKTYRLDVSLVGANRNAEVVAEGKQNYTENYYLQHCLNGINVGSFSKITYKNIYKNIDWVLYTKGDKLEYDFIVRPGGNAKDIKIKYDGATKLFAKNGTITATTPFGSITEQKPYTYQAETKKELASAFVLKGNTISFAVAPHKETIVIDPTLSWATYYGGNSNDWAYDVATDTAGNVYMFGSTFSTNYIATSGSFQSSLDSNADAYVVKFNSSGVRQWATYFGGKGNDVFFTGFCDNNGNLFVGGLTTSTNLLATPGAYQTKPGGGFFVKFNTGTGNRQMASYLNGTITGMTTDNAGNIYAAGNTSIQYGIGTPGSHRSTLNGTGGFLIKFDPAFKRHWGSYYYGDGSVVVNGVCADAQGNAYICGTTTADTGIATKGSYKDTCYVKLDHGFIAKFDAYGNRTWATYYGDTTDTKLNTIICDGENNVYAGGMHAFITSQAKGMLTKFNYKGQHLWVKYYGTGTGNEVVHTITLNNAGDIYAKGVTTSTSGIATANGYKTTYGGGPNDAFLAQFNPSGLLKWGTYYGGAGDDAATLIPEKGLTFNWKGKVYLASKTSSTTGISLPGNFKDTIDGSSDAYLVQFTETDTSVYIPRANSYITICQGIINFTLDYSVTRNFNSGNTFTAYLSDTGGNFALGSSIGSHTSNTSGTMHCALPLLSLPGDHYRLRIISSSPVDTSESYLVNIYPAVNPYVHIAVHPNDTACNNDTLTFYADTTRDGGINPTYQWRKNNVNIPGETNATYITTSLSNMDTICCIMTSSHPCAHAPGVSNCIIMNLSSFLPTAKLTATPSNVVPYGDTITFSVTVTNAGLTPLYQWKKNGTNIPGATQSTLKFYNGIYGDRISVKVSSSLFCAQPDTVLSDTMTVIYTGNVNGVHDGCNFTLYPNPNKGQFMLTGTINSNGRLKVEVLNTIGQVIYKKEVAVKNGVANEEIDLNNKPKGVYMIRITAGTSVETLRFVIDK